MPVYEYRCQGCGRRYSALVGVVAGDDVALCPSCGEAGDRLVSRFVRGRHEDDRIDEMADRLESMGEPESSGQARDILRELGKAMDDDVADEMEAMLDADLSGEDGLSTSP